MKKYFTVVLLFLLVQVSFSQKTDYTVSQGATALLFYFKGLDNLSLDNYAGGIGGKYFLQENLALRVGLQFNGNSQTIPANPDTSQFGVDGEKSSMDFGLLVAAEWHLKSQRVSPFVGGGLNFFFSSSEQKEKVLWDKSDTGIITRMTTKTSGGFNYGVMGIAGVEFYITRSVSLTGEYQLSFNNHPSDEVETTIDAIQGTSPDLPYKDKKKGPSTSSYGINSAGYLTLAVYF